jgi:hypothetical protein
MRDCRQARCTDRSVCPPRYSVRANSLAPGVQTRMAQTTTCCARTPSPALILVVGLSRAQAVAARGRVDEPVRPIPLGHAATAPERELAGRDRAHHAVARRGARFGSGCRVDARLLHAITAPSSLIRGLLLPVNVARCVAASTCPPRAARRGSEPSRTAGLDPTCVRGQCRCARQRVATDGAERADV